MMKSASLAKFTGTIFEIILTCCFTRSYWKWRLVGINSSCASNWMMVFTWRSILAPSGAEKVTTLWFSRSLRITWIGHILFFPRAWRDLRPSLQENCNGNGWGLKMRENRSFCFCQMAGVQGTVLLRLLVKKHLTLPRKSLFFCDEVPSRLAR